ncbi:hypothetical protein ACQP2F_38445 [Actinoplanes sp. CA-030573]|uniref:hypothetical protein n=1 Tax=Actinoplanes sp. CA-030573 TaxID=3239898 RepID=UPI003D89F396
MHTLALFLSTSTTAAQPGTGKVFAILGASGVLVFAFASMRKAVQPFAEVLKAAFFAVSTFLLIGLAVVLLLVSLVK